MIKQYGDMWSMYGKTDLFLITSNSSMTRAGKMVMGKGMALEAKKRIAGLDKHAALMILKFKPSKYYETVIMGEYDGQLVGLFQTKTDWINDSKIEIIKLSTISLFTYLVNNTHIKRVDLNYPGIGCGRLSIEEVEPIIELLPDKVHVWQKDTK